MKNLMLFVLSAVAVLAVACASARNTRDREGATLTAGDRSSGKRN